MSGKVKRYTFDDIHQAKNYADNLRRRGYWVDIKKMKSGKYRVSVAKENPMSEEKGERATKIRGGVKSKSIKRSMGGFMRSANDFDITSGQHPKIGDMYNGGDMPKIAQLPKLK